MEEVHRLQLGSSGDVMKHHMLDSAKQRLMKCLTFAAVLCLLLAFLTACQKDTTEPPFSGSYEWKLEYTTTTYTFSSLNHVELRITANASGAFQSFIGTYEIIGDTIEFKNWTGGKPNEVYSFVRTDTSIILGGIEFIKR